MEHGFTETILTAIGFSKSTAEFVGNLTGWQFYGAVLVIIFLFIGRNWLIPFFAKWIEAKRTNTNALLDMISELKNAFLLHVEEDRQWRNEQRVNITRGFRTLDIIETHAADAAGESLNTLDELKALRIFHSQVHKTALRCQGELRKRIRDNHIRGNENTVKGRYIREGERFGGKLFGMFEGLTCSVNGLAIDSYFCKDGKEAKEVTISWMEELFEIHLAYDQGAALPTDDDLEAMFDRVTSSFISSFKLWIVNGQDIRTQKGNKCFPELKLQALPSGIEIEVLNA